MQRSPDFNDQVIVLKVGQFREADCWVRFLASTQGIMTAFAFGGAKSRKRFAGCLDVLNHVQFQVVAQGRGQYFSLQEGCLLNRFSSLQKNLARLGMAVNCLKFLEAAHIGTGNASEVFRLFLQTLLVLDQGNRVPQSLPILFRARLAALYGYQASLRYCVACGLDLYPAQLAFFSIAKGNTFCAGCLRPDKTGVPLRGLDIASLEAIFNARPHDWSQDSLYQDLPKPVLQALDRFVIMHLELVWENGRFRQC